MITRSVWQMLFSVALVCSSCVNSQQETEKLWNSPMSTPEFVYSLPIKIGMNIDPEYDMCVGIREDVIFDPGDDGGATYQNIQKTVQVIIDGESVETRVYSDLLLLGELDENGNYLGSHGGVDHVCFDLPHRDTGLYLAVVQVSSTSGRKFEHRWAIQI